MLECKVKVPNLTKYNLDCGQCNTCQPVSKLIYPFDRDLITSDDFVRELMKYIQDNTNCFCEKTKIYKNPDIDVYSDKEKTNLICRVEAKFLEGKAFVKSKTYMGIAAREVLVVDKPKLLSYFQCKSNDKSNGKNIPIYVAWKFDRPCKDIGGITVYQEIDRLKEIYDEYGSKREFERKTTQSDIKDGNKMGITAKYHFSVRECKPIEEIILEISNLV